MVHTRQAVTAEKTQKILEMHNHGHGPRAIAEALSLKRDYVRERLRTCQTVPNSEPKPQVVNVLHNDKMWDLDPDELRDAIIRKAAKGAREALRISDPSAAKEPSVVSETFSPGTFPVVRSVDTDGPWRVTRWPIVIAEVCAAYKLQTRDLAMTTRASVLVKARQETAWRLWYETELSSVQIGEILGRDHTTILSSIRRVEKALHGGTPRNRPNLARNWWEAPRTPLAESVEQS